MFLIPLCRADTYDPQTYSLCHFLLDLALLDHRFVRLPPSMIAAVALFLAKRMMGTPWHLGFIFYSQFAAEQLAPAANLLRQKLLQENINSSYVYPKHAWSAALHARKWAMENPITPLDWELGELAVASARQASSIRGCPPHSTLNSCTDSVQGWKGSAKVEVVVDDTSSDSD